jgi:hypothetical protein
VQTNRTQKAYVAQERVGDLADLEIGRVVCQAFFDHQLLGVVRPAFRKRVADEQLTKAPASSVGMQKL